MPEVVKTKLLKKEYLKTDIIKFTIKAENIAKNTKPGNFIEVRINETTAPFLRRPFCIYYADKSNGTIEFIFQIKGEGTKLLAKKEEGDLIDIIGPLGKGTFDIKDYKKIAIIGGGIGTFPLYQLSKDSREDNREVNIYLGFKSKEFVVLENEFKELANKFTITTDDGSYGEKGFAVSKLEEYLKKDSVDCIFACGSLPMLKAVKKFAMQNNIPCQISLEERMGCGIGVCLGCAVKTSSSSSENPEYLHVCKEGPVFWANEVDI